MVSFISFCLCYTCIRVDIDRVGLGRKRFGANMDTVTGTRFWIEII
jgi:hypothetical protein